MECAQLLGFEVLHPRPSPIEPGPMPHDHSMRRMTMEPCQFPDVHSLDQFHDLGVAEQLSRCHYRQQTTMGFETSSLDQHSRPSTFTPCSSKRLTTFPWPYSKPI